jgi:hypothetical protein
MRLCLIFYAKIMTTRGKGEGKINLEKGSE